MIHKKIFRVGFVFCFVAIGVLTNAQEVVFPLSSNPVIKQYIKEHPVRLSAMRIVSAGDTLTLPFIDDFSNPGIYPSENLWNDSDAFVNTTFCNRPVTIGVATLDGIDKYGNPHDELSTQSDLADHLTSKPINLNFPGDTTIWFSFYYQPQGLGDEPELYDSLALQFKDSTGTWNVVWSALGRSDSAFKRINIHITDSAYKYNGFQFRFLNYATINGNRDHWNLDYVWLGQNRSANDSILEIGLVNPINSYLKDYTALPYSHYKHLTGTGNNPVISSVIDLVRCFKLTGATTITMKCNIKDANSATVFDTSFIREQSSSFNAVSNSDLTDTAQVRNMVFPSDANVTYADFKVRHFFNTANFGEASNDTSYMIQRFQNYYAVDDGTAEWAYGIPETGAKMAYKFHVVMRDTLRGIKIYFNQVGDIVHNRLFQICLWNSIEVASNSEHLVYKTIDMLPANIDSINGFATYLFDSTLVVDVGNIYIGLIQNDASMLGIGLDRNTVSTENMFAFYTGYWHQSQITGSWMMRPVFGDSVADPIGIKEVANSLSSVSVYPNPASKYVSVIVDEPNNFSMNYQLFNGFGAEVLSGKIMNGSINLSGLANGFYFIRLTNQKSKESVTRKLVVQNE